MQSSPRALLTLMLAAALLVASGASESPAQEQPLPGFADAVDVRIVNIDVYVTDKVGRPVADLDRSDFLVFEDGHPVEVSNFSYMRRGAPPPREAGLHAEPDAEPGAPESAPSLPAGSAEPLTVILYIDNSALTPPHRNRVLGDLEDFVDREAGQGTRFLVAAYNLGLEFLTPLTADAAVVREALTDLRKMPASGLNALSERRTAMAHIPALYRQCEETGQNPCVGCWGQMIGVVDAYAQSAGHRVGNSQGGLLGLTRSLGGLPGRKSLVYLSDGLEQRPGIDLYAYLGELCPDREREMFSYLTRWDETSTLQELTAYANTHRVTLYALETTGLTNFSVSSVEFDERRFAPSPRNDFLRTSNLQNSLFILADETGGRAFFNANRPGPELERLSQDLGEYYSLGFAPGSGWDGETHAVRVKLAGKAGKGLRVRYRQRYRAVPEDERMAERTLAALVMGWEENPLGTELRVGEQQPQEDGIWEVPVEIVLPFDALASLPGPEGSRRLVRVLMMAEDQKSRRTPMREKLIALGGEGDAEGGSGGERTVVVNVQLGPGTHTIAIGVRDELSRIASFHRATVEIEAAARGSSNS